MSKNAPPGKSGGAFLIGVALGGFTPSCTDMISQPDDQLAEPELDAVLERAWGLLESGASDRRHGFHTPALATVGLDGIPQVRTVVLRAADRANRSLRIHTDRRAPKVREMEAEDRVSLAFYAPTEKTQVRVSGLATLHAGNDPLALEAWSMTSRFGRRCYLASLGPGTPASAPTSGLPPVLEGQEPSWEATQVGLNQFTAVRVRISMLDWLHLAHTGHRRARFRWDENETPTGVWCAP